MSVEPKAGPSRYAQLQGLLESAYGRAPAESELEWWFDGNPIEPSILSLEEAGADGMSLFRVAVEGRELVAGFIVHAVTAPQARGRGVFSRLQQENEHRAAEAGAALALGFTTAAATRVLTGKLGWELLARPRVWARLRPRRGARVRGKPIGGFLERHEQRGLGGPAHLLKDAAWLDWRYRESPREYRLVERRDGYAVVGLWHGRGVVCEHVGGRDVLQDAVRAVEAPVVLALPGGRRSLYASLGFVPTPRRLNLVGRRLDQGAPLPREWRLSLGDTDFC